MTQDRYRVLFERSADAILIIVGNKFVDCNEATVKMLRYKNKQDLLDTHPSQLSPERQSDGRMSYEKAEEMIATAFQNGSNRFEWDHLRADGEVIPVEVLLTAVQEEKEPALHVVWREISDRKKVEAALQKSFEELEQRVKDRTSELRSINQQLSLEKKKAQDYLDVANVMLVAWDIAGEITMINTKGCEILEFEAKDILGKNWFDHFMIDGNRDAVKDAVGRILRGENSSLAYYEAPIRTASGSERTLAFNNSLLRDQHGRILSVLSSGTDITEKIIAEEEKKKMQDFLFQQDKMASIGQLAAGVAHEINNPMAFITSNFGTLGKYIDAFVEYMNAQAEIIGRLNVVDTELDTLRDRLEIDFIQEDIKELLVESLDGATRVSAIVQNLKGFSHIDDKSSKPSDINACLESTIKVVWHELKYKATLQRDYGDLPLVICNAQQLNQVFINILVNAAQAIKDKGEINIRTWHDQQWLNISISDNGCGIAKDKVDRIFEPFFTTKEVGKGTGLGLSISYDIIKNHNGNIKVDSQVGKGTCFTLSIPMQESQQNR